jgi:ABC-type sugar transport system permease subunit
VGKIISTIIIVVVAVGVSAALWVSANLLFNQVRSQWVRFCALAGAVVGFLIGVVLHGNLVTLGSGRGFLTWVWFPLLVGVAVGAICAALARTDDPRQRIVIGTVSGLALGAGIGAMIREDFHPGLDPVATIAWTAGGMALGAGISALRRHRPVGGALIGGSWGWIVGAWGAADLGDGSMLTSIVATAVPFGLIGLRLGLAHNPDYSARREIDRRSRAVIFLAPALTFIFITLVIPTLRTMYLSLLDQDREEFVGLENYGATFADPVSWDTSTWTNVFTSRLFWIGLALLAVAVVVGVTQKRRTGRAVEVGGPTPAPLIVGGLFLAFAVLTTLRGTIANNLWWVITVTFASTAIGLAVAVLADRSGGEKIAKSFVFMPMAISLVGASIIWRFMYAARDTSNEQTGVLNALWVGLGNLSTGSGLPTIIGAIVLGLVLMLAGAGLARALVRRQWARAVVPGVLVVLVGWAFVRYLGSGIGGIAIDDDGTTGPDTILFLQESPFNNFWLMVILIWIQTGFAMVILSAAIKAVPTEFIEAARVDGATDSQIFWRITLPQIATTIGVVVTTLIVLVMKVFDIVKVTTNGQFGTQVLANDMFQQAFQFTNTGRGAALAVILFLSVLPVMFVNIRRMQREG